jgi:hypothetical protein
MFWQSDEAISREIRAGSFDFLPEFSASLLYTSCTQEPSEGPFQRYVRVQKVLNGVDSRC